jgi:hypothetical protein
MKYQKHLPGIKNIFNFLFVTLTFSFLISFSPALSAQNLTPAKESSKVDYTLSFPGLLPDHPLYFIKTARERIMAFFISNPMKKAEFNLLQADKRINASHMLIQKDKSKVDLAQSTFSKGENYFEEAVSYTREAKSQGVDITLFAQKLNLSNKKHKEILVTINEKLSEKDQKKFEVEYKRINFLSERVNELAPEK